MPKLFNTFAELIFLFRNGKSSAQLHCSISIKQLMQIESYLYSCCHCSSCCQIQPLPPKIHHGLVASFFGLYDVLINLLKGKHTEILEGYA